MSNSLKPHITLSDRFFTAVEYATTLHRDQSRKSTDIPYICHPLGVASLLIEAGATEDQIIGGLLHDIAEDCGGEPRLTDIEQLFGSKVAEIVRGCSDSLTETEEQKADWVLRKGAHLAHLEYANMDILMVAAADKLHNARAIATDYQISGDAVWKRFNKKTNKVMIIGYYNDILSILKDRGVEPKLLRPLEAAISIFDV